METGTYPAFMDLLYLFNPKIGEPEPEHESNVTAFLDALIQTPAMVTAHGYLVNWGKSSRQFMTNKVKPFMEVVSVEPASQKF